MRPSCSTKPAGSSSAAQRGRIIQETHHCVGVAIPDSRSDQSHKYGLARRSWWSDGRMKCGHLVAYSVDTWPQFLWSSGRARSSTKASAELMSIRVGRQEPWTVRPNENYCPGRDPALRPEPGTRFYVGHTSDWRASRKLRCAPSASQIGRASCRERV